MRALGRCVRRWTDGTAKGEADTPGVAKGEADTPGVASAAPRFRMLAADLRHAAARTRPSALRALMVQVPKVHGGE